MMRRPGMEDMGWRISAVSSSRCCEDEGCADGTREESLAVFIAEGWEAGEG